MYGATASVYNRTALFNIFFRVPLLQTKHLRVALDTKNINDMQFLQFQFNFS
jgi:hypothetical protein